MSQEILGEWVCKVDYKWRLVVPASIRKTIGKVVSLKLNTEDCIEIKKFRSEQKGDSFVIAKSIKGGRITIPPWLRDSNSFYYGKKVMLVLQNGHCEIWPWR